MYEYQLLNQTITPICYKQLYIYLIILKYLHVYIQKLNGKFSWECRLEPQLNKVAANSSDLKNI